MNLKPLTGALDTCFFPKMSELITIGKVATGPQIANCRTGHRATTWYMSLQLPCWASRPDGHLSNALNDCREFLERERATCSPAHSNVSKSQLLSQTELCPKVLLKQSYFEMFIYKRGKNGGIMPVMESAHK